MWKQKPIKLGANRGRTTRAFAAETLPTMRDRRSAKVKELRQQFDGGSMRHSAHLKGNTTAETRKLVKKSCDWCKGHLIELDRKMTKMLENQEQMKAMMKHTSLRWSEQQLALGALEDNQRRLFSFVGELEKMSENEKAYSTPVQSRDSSPSGSLTSSSSDVSTHTEVGDATVDQQSTTQGAFRFWENLDPQGATRHNRRAADNGRAARTGHRPTAWQ